MLGQALRGLLLLTLAALSGCSTVAFWRSPPPDDVALPDPETPGNVIDPEIERREVKVTKIDTEDYEIGAFTGFANLDEEKALGVYGLRAGYLISEDWFVEATYLFQSGLIYDQLRDAVDAQPQASLDYSSYDLAAAYNVLPGQFFVGSRYTIPVAAYLLAGYGETSLLGDSFATLRLAAGLKILPQDGWTLRIELGNRLLDRPGLVLGQYNNTLEGTLGFGVFF